jgi:ABC-type uncharacterized transport system permease subunit
MSAVRLLRTLGLVALLGLALTSTLVALIRGPGDVGPALTAFMEGVAGSTTALGATGKTLTPILLIAAAACLAFRAGLFDIGQPGQFVVGGVVAGAVAPLVPGPGPLIIVAAMLAGAVGGAAWSALVGRLAAIAGIELVVLSLVANFLADSIARYLTSTVLLDPDAFSVVRTRPVPEEAWLPTLLPRTGLHAGILIAIGVALLTWLVLTRTAVGHKLTMFGKNPRAAALAGVDSSRFQLRVLAASGAICGLAGAIEVLGVYHGYQDSTLGGANSIAWTGLTAAILVPVGALALLPVSALLAALSTGFAGIQRDLGIPTGLGILMAGVVIIAAAFAVRSSRQHPDAPRGSRRTRRSDAPDQVLEASRAEEPAAVPVGGGR